MVFALKNVAAAVALLVIFQIFEVASLPLDKSKGGKDKGKGDLVDGDVSSFADALAADIQEQLFLEDDAREKRSLDTSALAEDGSSSDAFADDAVAEDALQDAGRGRIAGKKPCNGRRSGSGGSGGTDTEDVDTQSGNVRQGRSRGGGRRGGSTTTEAPSKLAASWVLDDVPEGLW